MTPEETAESRRHVARMSTAELTQVFVKGPEAWPAEAWAILEEEVARREREGRMSRLQTAGTSAVEGEAPSKRRFGVIIGVLLTLGVLAVLGYAVLMRMPTALPTCGSDAAQSAVRDAIENSVTSLLVKHRLLALQGQTEVSYNEAKLQRRCRARAILNSGNRAINYRLYKLSATDATFFVEVTER